MKTLGVDIFPAHSPQAKGRIERLWQTLQSRLPVEFRRRGMKTVEEANSFLPSYIEEFNKRFSVPARDPRSAFVPLSPGFDLDRLLSARWTRTLSSGSTFSLGNRKFLVEGVPRPARTKVTVLLSERRGLRVEVNGVERPVHLLDLYLRKEDPGNAHTAEVMLELLRTFMLKDIKTA